MTSETNTTRPSIILLTNDDGINAPGLWALCDAVRDLGEVWVVAPDQERSGVSHAFTLATPLRVEKHPRHGVENCYAISGTPVDAAKLAIRGILPERPALLVAGINRGENSGVNLLYSGTVAGAMEGAIIGIPSIAISLAGNSEFDYTAAAAFARKVCKRVLADGLPFGTLLNVNVPNIAADIKGVKVTHQAESHYREEIERRTDPRGREYYWIGGANALVGDGAGSDMEAIRQGFISVTPIHARLTNPDLIPALEGWNLE